MAAKKTDKKVNNKDEMTIVQVAHTLNLRYLRARDLILAGKCGESRYEGRTLLVKRPAVEALRASLKRQGTG